MESKAGIFSDLNFENVKMLIVGDVMLDKYVWGDVKRISPEAPVPVFQIRRQSSVPGGAGNVALNACRLGAKVILVGMIGVDENGTLLQNMFRELGAEHLLIGDKIRPTITKTRIVANGQQLLRIDDEVCQVLSGEMQDKFLQILSRKISGCDIVIMSDYGKGTFQSIGLTEQIIWACRKAKVPVIIDPKGRDWERYRNATCITPNTAELELFAGCQIEDDRALIEVMHAIIRKLNLSRLLVTRGAKGMCLLEEGREAQFITAIAKEVFDVSGAGDTVIATLAAGVASGLSYTDAMLLSNMAAGIVVSKIGTQPITINELRAAAGIKRSRIDDGLKSKVCTLSTANSQIKDWTAQREKIVLTHGTFDIINPGHVHLLKEAKRMGDRLVVGLICDASLQDRNGGAKLLFNEQERAAILNAIDSVDLIVPFGEEDAHQLLRTIKPHIVVKSAECWIDEKLEKALVETNGGTVIRIEASEEYGTICTGDIRAAKNLYFN